MDYIGLSIVSLRALRLFGKVVCGAQYTTSTLVENDQVIHVKYRNMYKCKIHQLPCNQCDIKRRAFVSTSDGYYWNICRLEPYGATFVF